MNASSNVTWALVELAQRVPERLAIVEPGGRTCTFAQLDARTAEIAGGLVERGLGVQDRALVLAPMGIDLYELILGTMRAGIPLVLLDPSAPRVQDNLARIGVSAFLGSAKAQLLRLKFAELRGLGTYISAGFTPLPHRSLKNLRGAPLEPQDRDPGFPALLTFTTGSTGTPKTVARSHRFLDAQRHILAEHMGLVDGDVDLPTLPVFLLNSLAAGATCVLPDADLRRVDSVDPARVVEQLRGCTSTSGSPAFYAPIARWLVSRGEQLPGLQKLFTGGARVPPELLGELVEAFPNARIEVLYGSTEAEPIASISAEDVLDETAAAERAGRGSCVGTPVPQIELRIARPGSFTSLPTGEIGEVVVAGDHVNRGYFEDPVATAENKLVDGERTWHRTGDTGYLDERGRVWLAGRVSGMVGKLHPFLIEGQADGKDWVVRSALVDVDGPVLACAVDGAPEGWRDALASELGVPVMELPAIPVDPRHNAKIDRRKTVEAIRSRS